MACPIKQPTLVVEGDVTGDIARIVGFILHGASHALNDGNQVPESFFATFDNNQNVAVIDAHKLGAPELVEMAVRETAERLKADQIAFVAEAWVIPNDKKEAFRNGSSGVSTIEQHPDRFDIIVITVERPDGVWMIQAPILTVDGQRQLPEVINMTQVPEEELTKNEYVHMLPKRGAPEGVVLH